MLLEKPRKHQNVYTLRVIILSLGLFFCLASEALSMLPFIEAKE